MAKAKTTVSKAIEQSNVNSDIDNIKDDLASLKDNVLQLSKDTKNFGGVKATELKNVARQQLSQLQSKGQRQLKAAENQVRENPGQALAIAFGAGLLLSALLKRR